MTLFVIGLFIDNMIGYFTFALMAIAKENSNDINEDYSN